MNNITIRQQDLASLTEEVSSIIKEGDLIFIAIDSFLYRQVAKGTGSWTSHVGLIIKEDNEWYVLESAVPRVTRCPLKKFLGRSKDNHVCIRRLKHNLSDEQVKQLKTTAEHYRGAWYDLGFNFDAKRQFCSKFVYTLFNKVCNVEIGKVQTLEALLEENPQANQRFWRVWYFGFIPWKRRTVTPASQLKDTQFTTVYSNVFQ